MSTETLCMECDQRPVWSTDHLRGVPWNLCLTCLSDVVAGIRRRQEAVLRLMPLSDFQANGVESVTITFRNDDGPRR